MDACEKVLVCLIVIGYMCVCVICGCTCGLAF